MIHFNKYIHIASLCLLAASCGDDAPLSPGAGTDEPVPLQLGELSIESPAQTRATETGYIGPGSQISVGIDYGTDGSLANRHYIRNGDWEPLSPASTVYLTSKDANLYIYYPWSEAKLTSDAGTGFRKDAHTYQAVPHPYSEESDICYTRVENVNAQSDKTGRLTLGHIFARWKLKIKRKNFPGEGKVTELYTEIDTYGNYHFNPATGTWAKVDIPGSSRQYPYTPDITIPATGQAIDLADWLVPAYRLCISTIRMTIDGTYYTVNNYNGKLGYEMGKCYEATFVINGKDLTLEAVTVGDWMSSWAINGDCDWPDPIL